MSTNIQVSFLEKLGVNRNHVAVYNWVHEADLQLISTVSTDQLAIDEKVIRVNGDNYWLYGAVDPETDKILQFKLSPTVTKQIMQ